MKRSGANIRFGIKRKVLLGFILIALILFISSVIAVFEFRSITKDVSTLISRNTARVNSAKQLIIISDQLNFWFLENMDDQELQYLYIEQYKHDFNDNIDELETKISAVSELAPKIDSVRAVFNEYISVISKTETIWEQEFEVRKRWYFDNVLPLYFSLRDKIGEMSEVSEFALEDNYTTLRENYYRSIMPGVVAVGVGIVLVILFNYFLNIYLINPLVKMNRGIKDYRGINRGYNVTFDGDDDVKELNNGITDIIEENRALKRIK